MLGGKLSSLEAKEEVSSRPAEGGHGHELGRSHGQVPSERPQAGFLLQVIKSLIIEE